MFKRCPFCHRIVWFWQKKCYLDAKSKQPCHAYCWVWNLTRERQDAWRTDYPAYSPQQFMAFVKEGDWTLYERKKEVEKVEDETWRKDLEK